MFNCYSHNWSHIEKPCPLCNPMRVYSISTAYINTVTVDSLQAELTTLKAKYQKAVEALQILSNCEEYIRDYRYGHIAPRALVELGEKD